jgi:glyoxylase-like metal-dependent hydrolase (beta-lactamase superfamily II)
MHLKYGFPEAELRSVMENHPGYRYGPSIPLAFCALRDGEKIEAGNYTFRCTETRGHSPGHMCLYEERSKILISGDHILFGITPSITQWLELHNSLGEYLTSLKKVYALDVELVLPGHNSIMNSHRKRIKELRQHHKRRLDELLHALRLGEKTAWEVAPFLSWDIEVSTWEDFPPIQKWFALGETVAHLQYLVHCGTVVCKKHKDRLLFSVQPCEGGRTSSPKFTL